MNENSKKRREWVKTAAIVFLSIMLVLTFFSNTIMNYSLPEVAAQYVESGTITAKIRGNGVVESSDPYEVTVKETRKVTSVAVKTGDTVQKGDVLVYLEDKDSDELEAARKALEDARRAYDTALLAADVNAQVLHNSNSNISTVTYRQQITNAQTEVENARKSVDEWTVKYNDVSTQLAMLPSNDADIEDEQEAYDDAKTAKENADFALQSAKDWKQTVDSQFTYEMEYNNVSAGDGVYEEYLNKQKEAEQAVINAQTVANNAALNFSKAETALNNKKAEGDTSDTREDLTAQLASVSADKTKAEQTLQDKTEYLNELLQNINSTLNLQVLYDAIADAEEEVNEQSAKAVGATITADIAGTVTSINAVAGKEVSAAEAVAVLQPEGRGYTMSFSVTNEQAKRLAVGDVADLVNSWRYDDVEVTLASIKPDPSEPGQKKKLTFDVTGSIVAGQTLNISVGQKSANFDNIVPNSAIREDNNGKFVLIVETKSSPLGNRYMATRMDVEVIASDDTRSAVSGALEGYEFVITTSNKPVEAGQLVRLPEN